MWAVNQVFCLMMLIATGTSGFPSWDLVVQSALNNQCIQPYPTWGCINLLCYNIGTQGPCDDDQVFLKIPNNFNAHQLRGGALGKSCAFNYGESRRNQTIDVDLYLDLNDTHPPLTNPDQSYGYCVWNDSKHPCNGLPANQRYSNETERCHTIGLQEYCPLNQVFYDQRYISYGMVYGSCDCYPLFEMWYDPKDGNCYPPHSQGSCPHGHWLTIKKEYDPVECEPAPCPADGKHVYWTEGHQQCYLRGGRGPCAESPYEEFLGHPFGVLRCTSLLIVGPTIASRSPPRLYCETWQTASRLSQISQECDSIRTTLNSYSKNINSCGEGTYSRALKRCVYS